MLDRSKTDAEQRAADPGELDGDGLSPVAMPKTTGITAETPAIGATTLITPISMPR